jgi:hypothetical protein
MTSKAFNDALGEGELRLTDRVRRGLIASERVQYYLTLLQAAKEHAVDPARPTTDLRVVREAVGLRDSRLDSVVPRCDAVSEGDLAMPAALTIMHGLFAELAVMLHSLRVAADETPDLRPALARYALRLARLHADAPSGVADRLPAEAIDALTRTGNGSSDCVWQLTIDLHAELNRVLTRIPTRSS